MFGMSTQPSSSLSSTSLALPVSKPRNLSHAPPQQSNHQKQQQQQQHSNSNFALQFDALEARLLKRIDDRFDLLESRLIATLDLLSKSLSAEKFDRRDEQQAAPESKC